MANEKSFGQRFSEFRPSKTMWFWSSVALVVATMVIGFTWGGWVTGGTAQQLTKKAVGKARAQLIAGVCVQRFKADANFPRQLVALKKIDPWDRGDFIEKGKWTLIPGVKGSSDSAASICAQKLAKLDLPKVTAKKAAAGEGVAPSKTGAHNKATG